MQGRSLLRGVLPDLLSAAAGGPPSPRRLLFQAGAWTALDLPPLPREELAPWLLSPASELLAVALEEKSIPTLDHFARAHDLDLGPDLAGLAAAFKIVSDRLYVRAAPILTELSQAGIPMMLLKGGDVDLSLFRGEPPRTMFDLDFMIPPPAVPRVEETFREFGFEQGLYDAQRLCIVPIPEDQKAELQAGDFELLDFVKIEKAGELDPRQRSGRRAPHSEPGKQPALSEGRDRRRRDLSCLEAGREYESHEPWSRRNHPHLFGESPRAAGLRKETDGAVSQEGYRDRWLVSPPDWSKNPAKRRRFEQECYFQEAVTELRGVAGGRTPATLGNKTFIVFKPDAAPVRCAVKGMAVLAEQGIRPIAVRLFTFDRLMLRELWRYELNLATYARYPAIDALLTRAPSLFVLLERDVEPGPEGLAEFLSALKGPSQVQQRQAHHLRTRIGAGNGVLNHIHTPEETIDVLREIAILFDRPERRSLLEALASPRNLPVELDDALRSFNAFSTPHSLRADEIRHRFLREQPALDFAGLVQEGAAALDFEAFRASLAGRGVAASWWDAMTLFVAERPLAVEGILPVLKYEREAAVGGE